MNRPNFVVGRARQCRRLNTRTDSSRRPQLVAGLPESRHHPVACPDGRFARPAVRVAARSSEAGPNRELYSAAGWTLTLLAWISTDLGQPEAAETHLRCISRFRASASLTRVSERDMSAIVTATEAELSAVGRCTVEAGPVYVDAETVQVALQPIAALAAVRSALRRGIAVAWGPAGVPESEHNFRPRVTLAYSTADNDRTKIADAAVAALGPVTVKVQIEAVTLIRLNRDNQAYEWDELATIRLPGS